MRPHDADDGAEDQAGENLSREAWNARGGRLADGHTPTLRWTNTPIAETTASC